jgi:ATP-binding cassette subfamily F protein 3
LLSESKASAIIISHDRRFLDRVTTETWEIEGERIRSYPAPYTQAKALRAERVKSEGRAYQLQQSDISRQEEFIRRYGAGQRARQAQGRLKRLERLERLDRPEDQLRAMALDFPAAEKPGRKILGVRRLAAGFGLRTLFQELSFEVDRGEVIGIAGPNGSGKTTLLRVLSGEVEPIAGEFGWGDRVRKGLLMQEEEFPEPESTALDFIRSCAPQKKDQQLRNLLAAMLYTADSVHKPASILSGGERKRLMLTRLLMQGNNVLLFDEPTNHLDLPSREAVELALSMFEGTIFIVSHDRYFLDLLADRMIWIEDGEWHLTEGGAAEALDQRAKRKAAAKALFVPEPAPKEKKAASSARLATADLEAKIIGCEERIRAIDERFTDPKASCDPAVSRKNRAERAVATSELAALEAEYKGR